jgi:all-trans-retinol 13,14-reductase
LFIFQALLNNHYAYGAFYPVGGASEIAYNMIPVIERNGGKVLVNADVKQIVFNGKKACGVIVKKGTETYRVEAPIVISSAGIYNTFERLLPKEVSEKSYFTGICKQLKPGTAAMNVFLGFNASNEELNLKPHNIWAFTTNDSGTAFEDYLDMNVDQALDAKVPLMFVSFPSAKDPNWKNHPGRENKSTCAIVTLASWDW